MLVCARPLNEHRLADCLCKQGGIGGGVFMTVAVADSASLRAPIEEPRIADPDPIPRGGLHRRLRGGARCVAWQGRRRAFGLDRRASQGGLVGRAHALEQARPLGQTLRLFLGRRHSCSGPAGRRCAVPAGHYWRHTGVSAPSPIAIRLRHSRREATSMR
jgi:hypothetical protein